MSVGHRGRLANPSGRRWLPGSLLLEIDMRGCCKVKPPPVDLGLPGGDQAARSPGGGRSDAHLNRGPDGITAAIDWLNSQ